MQSVLFWCLCELSDCCYEGPWARPGRAVALRAVLSTRPPTPTRGGQARHRGGGGGRRATAAGLGQGRPLQVPQRGRRRSLRSLPAPTPGAPPGACAPHPGLISAQALHPLPYSPRRPCTPLPLSPPCPTWALPGSRGEPNVNNTFVIKLICKCNYVNLHL